MKAYELIMETLLRKTFIRVIHMAWLGTYAAIFLIPWPPELWNWGAFLFGWSGCLLPLLLSAGIFGDDIASGRISLLVTKPIRPGHLYLYRWLGLSLQGAVHLSVAGALIFGLHRFTGRGNTEHLAIWLLASWLVFNTWVALSTSLSVVVKREHNAMLLVLGAGIVALALSLLVGFFPESGGTKVFEGFVRWACPPVELLVELARTEQSLWESLGDVGHSAMLTVFYGVLGIILLGRREYKRTGD